MVNKADFLTDLKGFLKFEEDAVKDLSILYELFLNCKAAEKDCYSNIRKGIDILKKDTIKHARLINEMIEYVGKSGKNEF